MKWAFSITQKRRAALILGILFLAILVKNRIDYYDVRKLATSFATVYEDRLVVESYIYKLSTLLYQKKEILDNVSSQSNQTTLKDQISIIDIEIAQLMTKYKLTKLTELEDLVYQNFENDISSIAALESQYISQLEASSVTFEIQNLLNDQFKIVAGQLKQLSDIQLSEGRLLNDQSKSIVAGNEVLTQFELALLIGLGLIIQVLIFSSRTLNLPKITKVNLN